MILSSEKRERYFFRMGGQFFYLKKTPFYPQESKETTNSISLGEEKPLMVYDLPLCNQESAMFDEISKMFPSENSRTASRGKNSRKNLHLCLREDQQYPKF